MVSMPMVTGIEAIFIFFNCQRWAYTNENPCLQSALVIFINIFSLVLLKKRNCKDDFDITIFIKS